MKVASVGVMPVTVETESAAEELTGQQGASLTSTSQIEASPATSETPSDPGPSTRDGLFRLVDLLREKRRSNKKKIAEIPHDLGGRKIAFERYRWVLDAGHVDDDKGIYLSKAA